MRKFLIALLLSLSCSLTFAAVGCDSEDSSSIDSATSESTESGGESSSPDVSGDSSPEDSTEPVGETCKVVFTEGDGYFFEHEIVDTEKVAKGSTINFSIRKSVFYNGTPVVYIGESPIVPDAEGIYSVTVDNDITFTVDGVIKASSNMPGTGSMTDAFVVSTPADLVFIAEQVNAGVQTYVNGAYVLANDIDCGGEELKVIGDYSTPDSYFSGCFSCITDAESGAMERFTISNFTINSDSANYVGLFGTVFANPTVTSSGLFYGIGLDNFTINVSVSGLPTDARSVVAGSLVGYGSGANLYLCDATQGTINVYADDNYFAYAGGLIGYQQGFYDTSYGMFFPSEIAYAAVDTDINVLSGLALYAGGITGYAGANYPLAATAFIHNSYATGSVTGALRAGGIIGGLGQYTSVSNCYATGEIIARASQLATDALMASEEYCMAHAGGLAGYAENDTIVSDSFFDGTVTAFAASGDNYKFVGKAIGGGQETGTMSATAQKYIEYNCLSDITDAQLINISYFSDNLGWAVYDWIFESGKYPTICYDPVSTDESAVLAVDYVAKNNADITVLGASGMEQVFFSTTSQDANAYVPIGNFFYNGGLEFYYQADNGYLSYGYFFDKECTQKVPFSFVATRSIQLYVGFADPTPVIGTYQFAIEDSSDVVTLKLDPTGRATYSDGVTEQVTNYLFDGETLTIEAARLARYYNGEIIVDENAADTGALVDPNFDLYRYSFYDFCGKLNNGVLELYDGIYFTEANPLVASENYFNGEYYTKLAGVVTYYSFYGDKAIIETINGANSSYAEYDVISVSDTSITLQKGEDTLTVDLSTLSTYDAYKGVWTKSATLSKTYTFDGMGNWEYVQKSFNRTGYGYEETVVVRQSGKYIILDDDSLFFTHEGVEHSAIINADGFMTLTVGGATEQTYYREYSYTGTWSGNGITLELQGIRHDGTGIAVARYTDGTVYDLVYEVSETNGYVCIYWPSASYWKEQIFGYFTYDYASNTLSAIVYDTNNMDTGYSQASLFVLDDYNGEWICNDPEFENVEFNFDGNGLYGFLYGSSGKLVLDDGQNRTVVDYTLDSTLTGRFAYNGKMYTITYDENLHTVTISAERDIELERKDPLAGIELVDKNGNIYSFDGKGNLSKGGKFVVNETTVYGYKTYGNGFEVYDTNGNLIGTLEHGEATYILNLYNKESDLYIANEFMGNWAMGGNFQIFEIGPTDLNGNIQAVFDGHNVTMTYISSSMLTFRYISKEGMPITYYVYTRDDPYKQQPTLVLSQYTSLVSGDYVICTKANELYGAWIKNGNNAYEESIVFDGVSSSYANGIAKIVMNGRYETLFFYEIKTTGIVMWSQDLLGGKTWYYKIDVVDLATNPTAAYDPNAYVCGNKAIYRTEVDGLYLTEAKSEDGTKTYFFNGEGKLLTLNQDGSVGSEIVYTYEIKSYNTNNTATVHLTDPATGKTYEATLNYQDSTNIFLVIGDLVEAE